ncbi:RCC1 domain-containing protein [Geomesophilobacter sediminis]|uniref:Chromosome condensation regulator RCC1 n=1 Tax=Geomesophilobacter sediminis TaxID=2798584 RepID=A0A8J7M0M5_9BACT|nr:hypothetical protein [Geomesophilobacter sediminis]MBJ6725967.1 hypothetical protein [Geomesophilobacter sediminis]
MQMPKGKALLFAAGIVASALIYGCGGSSSNNIIPSVVSIFDAHNAVFRNNTALVTAGYNGFGQLGFDFGNLSDQTVYHPIAQNIVAFTNHTTGARIGGVAVGAAHTVAFGRPAPFSNITGQSLAYAWGSNYHGQLGNGTVTPTTGSAAYSRIPLRVGPKTYLTTDAVGTPNGGPLTGVTAVAAGGFHSVALRGSDGAVFTWGYNGYGELGNNNFTDSPWPVPVLAYPGGQNDRLEKITAIASGADHVLALRIDGTLFAWGDNTYGQCGQDNSIPANLRVGYAKPVVFPSNPGIAQIAAGGTFSVALANDMKTMFFWGNNIGHPDVSTLSLATPMPLFIPSAVQNHNIVKISAGLDHIVILLDNGTVYAIGFNSYGQLGDATVVSRPVTIIGNTTFSNRTTAWANFSTATHGSTRFGIYSSAASLLAHGEWLADDISAFGHSTMVHIVGKGWYGWGDNGHGQLGQPISTTSIGYILSAVPVAGAQEF